ncbi:MAG: fibro-slime domain-containing protein [Fibrobacteria bacterium]
MHKPSSHPSEPQNGYVLAFTIILIMGVTAISLGTLFNSKTGKMSASNYKNKLRNFLAADGMVTLLTQEILNGNGAKYIDLTRYGTINGHVWVGLGGITVKNLQDAMAANPTPGMYVTSNYLGKQVSFDNYGTKWFGYVIPPVTGNYTFFVRSDDAGSFYLSSDTSKNLSGKAPICSLATWVYDWPSSGSGVSAPQSLVGGNRYYFEFLVKEGTGFDIGQMGWDGPNQFSERPISGRYISQYPSDPEWNGAYAVGSLPVRYQVTGNGKDVFNINTEAITTKQGNPKDTIFRTPLKQSISLMGTAPPPSPTLDLPVIYYDYKSDRSNPEFNQIASNGVKTGMVNATLTNFVSTDAAYFGRPSIGKPTRSGAYIPNRSCGLNMWFKEWVTVNNVYRYADFGNCAVTDWRATGDAWFNVKRKGYLTLTLNPSQGKNTYVFSRMGNYDTGIPETSFRGDPSEFFPLDAFGKDPADATNPDNHNFSFCMEMHTTFTHQSGLIFEFTGDDDAWTFVNNKLEIDLGGIHSADNRMLMLDNLNLTYGQTYNFDFFQCERNQNHSSTRIATNIKMQAPVGEPVANWRRDYGSME